MLHRFIIFCGVLFTLTGVARGQETEAEPCAGLTVSEIVFDGCEKTRCDARKVQLRLIEITDMMALPWTFDHQEKARERLLKTGHFLELDVRCERINPVDARVVVSVVPNRLVSDVTVSGVKTIFTTDLEKRLFLRTGAVFNPDQKASQERLDRQLANLTSYMRQEGFDTAGVEVEVKTVGKDLVTLQFNVTEGKVSRIEKVVVELDGPWDKEVPSKYNCPIVKKRDIVRITGLQRGDLYTGRTARAAKRLVREFLQQYGFQAPRVKIYFDSETEDVRINVKLNHCFAIHILQREEEKAHGEGYEPLNESELFRALPFRESGIFDHREALLGIEELLVYYKTRGFLFAGIQMQFVDFRSMYDAWPYPLLGGVTYRITRGQPSEIREINFEGLRAIEAEELLNLMETQRYDFFGVGGYLQVEQLFADLDIIRKYYQDKGMFRMTYSRALYKDNQVRVQQIARADHTIYRYHFLDKSFDVIKPNWENAISIIIGVNEGVPSRVREVALQGITALTTSDVAAALQVKPGGDFSPKLVRAAIRTLEKLYQAQGRSVQISVACHADRPEVTTDVCDVQTVQSERVDLTFTVIEGEQHLMGTVLAVGNLKTAHRVIARDFPDPGAPFDRSRIDDAIRRLRNLGVFSSVRLVTIGPDEDPPRKRVDVVVQVEEAGARFIEFSVGFQKMYDRVANASEEPMSSGIRDILSTSLHNTGSPLSGSAAMHNILIPDVLLLGEAAFTNKNLLGYAKTLHIPISYGFTTRDPARYAAFKPTYYDLRFFGSDISMRLTPLIVYDRALSRVDKFEYGIENELSYQIRKGIYTSLTTRITRLSWKWPQEAKFLPMEWEFSIAPSVRFDFRDNPIHPTSGFYLMGRIRYLNAYELVRLKGDTGTVSDGSTGTTEDWRNERENFFQYELQGQAYLSFRKKLIFAINARYGHTYTVEEDSNGRLPPTHRFYLGGTTGVRGFPAQGVLQYNRKGLPLMEDNPGTREAELEVVPGGGTMLNGSLEMRFPILQALGLWGGIFLDAGAVANDLGSVYAESFRFTAGFGIRWLLGDQIPIRLDYGLVIDPRCNLPSLDDNGKRIPGECARKDDAGALDFGLLYTF